MNAMLCFGNGVGCCLSSGTLGNRGTFTRRLLAGERWVHRMASTTRIGNALGERRGRDV
jgi:hypothetical protein